MERETRRQLFHIIVGLIALGLLLWYGRMFTLTVVFFILIIGTALINARLMGKKIFLVDWFEKRFERDNAPFPGWGSACYATGVLVLLVFLGDINRIAAGIFVLAVGDAVSTLVGRRGTHPLPYNRSKTFEGLLAFVVFSLPAYFFIGPLVIPLALLAAIVETQPIPIDDNISVPLASVLFLLAIK